MQVAIAEDMRPVSPADDHVQAIVSEYEQHRDRCEELRGDDPGPSAAEQMVDTILSMAVSHDRVCQYLEDRMYRKLGVKGRSNKKYTDDDVINEFHSGAVELCARLAPIAQQHVPTRPFFAQAVADHLVNTRPHELDEFLRSIFEQAGIGDRFEPRQGFEVYGLE